MPGRRGKPTTTTGKRATSRGKKSPGRAGGNGGKHAVHRDGVMTTTTTTYQTAHATSETKMMNFDGCVLADADGCARRETRPTTTTTTTRDDGKRTPNAETDGGYFISCVSVPFRRKIGGPTRRSAKGGWTPEEVRGLKFENLNARDGTMRVDRCDDDARADGD